MTTTEQARPTTDDVLARSFDTVIVERDERVGIVTINRPEALNALSLQVMDELVTVVEAFDRDPAIGCIVITGSAKAFAAGADIKEMSGQTYMDMYMNDHFSGWEALDRVRTPMIAAVAGFALGGGCELAMMCDFILAADSAKFGQPEVKLGVMSGMGGTQRLTRAIGQSKSMELCLTGRFMDAEEAERAGLVARVVPADDLLDDARRTAATIAGMSLPITQLTKETVRRAQETSLREGLLYERRVFYSMFATDDQTEGMAAFVEKRAPAFVGR